MLRTWFRDLPVGRKIFFVVGYFSLVLLTMLVLAVRDVHSAQVSTEAIYQQNLLPTGDLTVVRTSLLRALVLANNVMRAAGPGQAAKFEADMDQIWRVLSSPSPLAGRREADRHQALGRARRRFDSSMDNSIHRSMSSFMRS